MTTYKICRLGDKSDHGGTIVSATGYELDGIQVALEGDYHDCPKKGHGRCTLIGSQDQLTFDGKRVIVTGDKATCGATMITGSDWMTIEI